MNTINDGGPAFPVDDHLMWKTTGMTLRDYFAAKAMQTLVHDWCEGDPKHAPKVAELSYAFADAMIAARQTKETKE